MADPIEDIAAHATSRVGPGPDDATRQAARTFILDSLGVAIGGAGGPGTAMLAGTLPAGVEARVPGTALTLSAADAALLTTFQTHCQEYDCVHDRAVVHVMTAVLPTILATARHTGPVTGAQLMEAVVVGVDVAATLGLASKGGLRFFRPGTAGAFGATAALGRLMGFDAPRMVQAFSLVYGQVCGTMQAHAEGSGLLALQLAFNARNAVVACDLARAGLTGPQNILMGPFGYFTLIEDGGDPDVLIGIGAIPRITEVSHKPFPSGRATHGVLDGALTLQRTHEFTVDKIASIDLTVPPLVNQLVGRAPSADMTVAQARLCVRYVTACALRGSLGPADFKKQALRDPNRQNLAARITIDVAPADPNALTPVTVRITLTDGRTVEQQVTAVYGAPDNPMDRAAQLAKFHANCADAPVTIDPDPIIALIDGLEDVADITALINLCCAPAKS